ncbi:hypothetical protein RchiOBHm_Chr1g0369601 [Rosa chinensis]|uniref:Uncharacterized protein n=1 Tax=Rosa chinensis TaxID=74649 RepID=A0A2P6SL39_ROSCH|nr:hypothetical protein RchiOBHm_Chr1g0369601 [Rosa chinensis]
MSPGIKGIMGQSDNMSTSQYFYRGGQKEPQNFKRPLNKLHKWEIALHFYFSRFPGKLLSLFPHRFFSFVKFLIHFICKE